MAKVRNNDRIVFVDATPGQKHNRHNDGSVTNNACHLSRLSLLIYLNECDGGETVFRDYTDVEGERVKQELRIAPKPGLALLFRHERWHEGSPVASGKKYVLRSDVFYKVNRDE